MQDINNRQIRVFVSSTFKDMNKERSHIAINIFPWIRKEMLRNGVNFSWCDLRWGITDEEAQAGLVVPKCIQSIDECDFFVGIIGEYYGTSLSKHDVETLEMPIEYKSQILRLIDSSNGSSGISITEIEILHRLLRSNDKSNICFFLKKTSNYQDARLVALVDRIKNEGYTFFTYSSIEQLGHDLSLFIENTIINPLRERDKIKAESIIQETIMKSYLEDRHSEDIFEEINWKLSSTKNDNEKDIISLSRFYHKNNHAITGEWGCGKSSLVANWINRILDTNQCYIVYYFINAISSYTTPEEIAYYFSQKILEIEEYKNCIKDTELPGNPIEKLQKLLSYNYHIISKPLVIAIDGIDNLVGTTESSQYAKSLQWIGHIHPRVFLLISATDNDYSIAHFSQLGIKTQRHQGIDQNIAHKFACKYLYKYHKNINQERLYDIIHNDIYLNPLFLKRLLDLLISCDDNNSLNTTINQFAECSTKEDFISLYFEKLHVYFPTWFKEFLAFLAISKNGLYRMELDFLIANEPSPNIAVQSYNQEIQSICSMLEDFIVILGDNTWLPGGLVNYRNEIVKSAILKSIFSQNDVQLLRKRIVNLLTKNQNVNLFISDRIHLHSEFLHQSFELQDYQTLYSQILSVDFFLRVRNNRDYMRYWRTLINKGCSLTAYLDNTKIGSLNNETFINYSRKVIMLVRYIGKYDDILLVCEIVIAMLRKRQLLQTDEHGQLRYFSLDLALLLRDIIETMNEYHEKSAIFLTYEPLTLTLREKSNRNKFPNYTYLLFYTEIMQCDTLMMFTGKEMETEIYNLLFNILQMSGAVTKNLFEQHQHIDVAAVVMLLKLASYPWIAEIYRGSIIRWMYGNGHIDEALGAIWSYGPQFRKLVAQFYLYAFKSVMPVWKEDNTYLKKSISLLEEIEKEGEINVNKDIVECYVNQIKWYKSKNDMENARLYKELLYKRLYNVDYTPRYDIPLYLWLEIKENGIIT